ncbi:hypothetical protein GCM10009558_018240 [Virgisporangium aurantiacum]
MQLERVADAAPVLAVDDGEAVNLWDVHADAPFAPPLTGPVGYAHVVADGPGTLITTSATDNAVAIWNIDRDRPPTAPAHRTNLRCLTVTAGGSLVAGGGDGTLSRWRLADGAPEPDLGQLPSRVNAVAAVTDTRGGHVLAVGGDLHGVPDSTLYHWIDDAPQEPVTLDHGAQTDFVATYSVDGETAVLTAGKGCGNAQLRQLDTGLPLGTIPHDYPPYGVAVGLWAGRPAAAVNWMFGPFVGWDLTSHSPVSTPAAANVQIGEAPHAWIETGTGPAVITVHDAQVRIHALLTGAVVHLQPRHDEPVTALAVTTHPGRPAAVAIARTDGTVSVVDPATNRETAHLTLPYPATAMAWAPEDGLLAIAYRDHIRCVEVPAL